MTQWEETRRRPVLPWYLAALVWPVAALALPIYQPWALGATAVLSAAVGLAAARLCPARLVRRQVPCTTGDAEAAGRAILEELRRAPDKAPQLDRFARYYLPEAVKIMSAYARLQRVQGPNADGMRQEVLDTAGTIAQAFENQLDALYSAEALDLSTDIEVLESILKSQNLAD